MKKMMVVGNFSENISIKYLEAFHSKYAGDFEILASGIGLKHLDGRYNQATKNSSKYIKFLNSAVVVVILNENSINFVKYNKTQRVIVFRESNKLSIIQESQKNHAISSYDDIVNFNAEDDESRTEFYMNFYNTRQTFEDSNTEEIINRLSIQVDRKVLEKDILVITSNPRKTNFSKHNLNGLIDYIRDSYDNYSIILLNMNLSEQLSLADVRDEYIYFQTPNANYIKKYIVDFDGIIIGDNWDSIRLYNQLVAKLGIEKSFSCQLLESKLELFFDSADILSYFSKIDKSENFEKQDYLKKLDEHVKESQTTLVSIIICVYNTPNDLLFRSIQSALNSTHDCIEVIVVNDGSQVDNQEEVKSYFSAYGDKVKYYYKENEGLGLSRNFGIRQAQGEYVFYLDSDDTIEPEGLRYMLTHAMLFDVDLVVGKRIICDEEKKYMKVSFPYLSGSTYRSYFHSSDDNPAFFDSMPNNKLIKKATIYEKNIWFVKGLYEDIMYTAKLFSTIEEYHFINVHIHNWYQYIGERTISSNRSFGNFIGRLEAIETAWHDTPELMKKKRLNYAFLDEIKLYLLSFSSFSYEEKMEAFGKLKEFLVPKINYYSKTAKKSDFLLQLLMRMVHEDDFEQFEKLVQEVKGRTSVKKEGVYDNFIAHTHYHIYYSILRALESKKPSRLFVRKDYQKVTDDFIERIGNLGIFEEVRGFSDGNVVSHLYHSLEKNAEDAYYLVQASLYAHFEPFFLIAIETIQRSYFRTSYPIIIMLSVILIIW